MDLFSAFVMLVVSYALQALTAPKQKMQVPDPGTLEVPKAQEGETIPIVFGTVLIKSPNVVWTGDASTTPIRVKGSKK